MSGAALPMLLAGLRADGALAFSLASMAGSEAARLESGRLESGRLETGPTPVADGGRATPRMPAARPAPAQGGAR
ncbi:hypothetical protein GPA19_22540 [Azoarcus indigens]|uniref:Uncharacterized protein n=1 Tax=Azoarcus indigens TaxID=29545 RepID=A0A4R6EHC9_9RHOO|nr:hypothetical protein [Azoarcus indigens]NMG67725.1 hypothetical protein [Azoarcus indigens]TDN56827.1 hypothetical protein C7389_101206 [Azoarcus indigens]